jgi:hypothetical protein
MAIFGNYKTICKQISDVRKFQIAFNYIARALAKDSPEHARILALPCFDNQTVQLGEGVFALEQSYYPKARTCVRFEGHKKYIDAQVIVAGAEVIEIADAANLRPDEDKTFTGDVVFFNAPEESSSVAEIVTSKLYADKGFVGVFFRRTRIVRGCRPPDSQMPKVRSCEFSKLSSKSRWIRKFSGNPCATIESSCRWDEARAGSGRKA